MNKTSKETINKNIWSLKELLHDAVRGHRVNKVAIEMGVPPKSLANEVNEYNNRHKLGWTDFYRFTALMEDFTVLDAFERKLGRVAIELEQFNQNIDENTLFDNLTDCLCQLGALGKTIKKARQVDSELGKEISPKELDNIEKQAFSLIRIILSVLAQLEPDSSRLEGK